MLGSIFTMFIEGKGEGKLEKGRVKKFITIVEFGGYYFKIN